MSDGSCLVTGNFQGTATFGLGEANQTSLTSAGSFDMFIARYNADGTLAWAKRAGGTDYDYNEKNSALSDGSCLVTGTFTGTVTFAPGEANATSLTSAGGRDLFIARYNPDGTLAWAKRAGGTSGDAGSSIAALSDGSCVVTGEFNGTATFGLGEAKQTALTSDGEGDIVIARYNADGTLAWSKQAGGTSEDVGQGISTLSDGSCLVTGSFTGSATFSPGEANQTSLTSSGAGDIFIAKYSSGGTLSWVKRTGGAGDETGQGISVLTNGSCLVTGSFAGTATFGPGETNATSLTSAGGYDVFVARFNPDGTFTPVP